MNILAGRGIECSMSRRGNCHDNAAVEAFFAEKTPPGHVAYL